MRNSLTTFPEFPIVHFFDAQLHLRHSKIAVAFVGGCSPPTYSDWTVGVVMFGACSSEASGARSILSAADYKSHDGESDVA